ncbi:MAG: peptidylprolyl isomerase, partial [Candidatus Eremiobacterota bacterium]
KKTLICSVLIFLLIAMFAGCNKESTSTPQPGTTPSEVTDSTTPVETVSTPAETSEKTPAETAEKTPAETAEKTETTEIRVRHILVKTEKEADEIIGKLKKDGKKADFAAIAMEKSECPSKEKGGDLGVFGKGAMVPEFEKAAFNLKIGEIGKVKTQFGWHVIERMELHMGEIKASHILVKTKEEAEKIIKELKDGGDFAKIAKEKSECPSKQNGGDLGYFGKGMMVPEFEKAAFALKVGEISKAIQTQFGWHVIKRTE